MRQFGQVDIPQSAFIAALRMGIADDPRVFRACCSTSARKRVAFLTVAEENLRGRRLLQPQRSLSKSSRAMADYQPSSDR